MSMRPTKSLPVFGACLLLALVGACARSQPTSFYTLAATTEPRLENRSGTGLVIGLGPVTVPQYLDRPDIVTREGDNRMRLAELHKWSEPLEPLLTRIMAEDLYGLLDANDVIPLPQRSDIRLDRVVAVDVSRFDADDAGSVVLDARWRVYRGDGNTLVTSGRSLVTEQGAPVPDYDSIVAAMSRAVGAATEEIAAAIVGNGSPPVAPTTRPPRPAA
jgi:uncharacterized lipoprotein YmbA